MSTSLWDRLMTSTPINRGAASGAHGHSSGFTELGAKNRPYGFIRSDTPLSLRAFPLTSDKSHDLTGLVVGRLTVMGMSAISAHGKGAAWVVRCRCGWYETRKAAALRDPDYVKRAWCSECEYLDALKKGKLPARPIILTVEKGKLMKKPQPNVEAASNIGFTRRPGGHDRHRIAWEIACSECGKKFSAYWNMNFRPEAMVKQMRVRRWDVGFGQRPFCPECAHPKKVKSEKPVDILHELPRTAFAQELVRASVELIVKQPDSPILTLQSIPEPLKLSEPHLEIKMSNKPSPSPKVSHAVFQTLDAHFDGDKRRYTGNGWDDARVAKEAGTTEEIVAYLRNETFGALAEDPRLEKIAEDITLLEMQFDEIAANSKKAFRDLHSRIDQVRASMGR